MSVITDDVLVITDNVSVITDNVSVTTDDVSVMTDDVLGEKGMRHHCLGKFSARPCLHAV